MTSDELSFILELKESYIRAHWPSIVKTYEKQKIYLCKVGRGEAAQYGIKRPGDDDYIWDCDAIEMF